jgi:hypothetical protein
MHGSSSLGHGDRGSGFVAPSFLVSAHAWARPSTCARNLAQSVRADVMYVEDYDERFPSCYSLSALAYAVEPRRSVQLYIKNNGVLSTGFFRRRTPP